MQLNGLIIYMLLSPIIAAYLELAEIAPLVRDRLSREGSAACIAQFYHCLKLVHEY